MKKKAIGISILILVLICSFLLAKKTNQTPYEFLVKNIGSRSEVGINEFLYQTDIGNKEYALFYVNEKNALSCAIIKKTTFSYSILKISSEVALRNCGEKANLLFGAYNRGNSWIYWGVIHDNTIKKVLFNNREANLADVEVYDFRICYLTGDETEKIIPPVHRFID